MKNLFLVGLCVCMSLALFAENDMPPKELPAPNVEYGQCSADRDGTNGTTITCGNGAMVCYTTNDSGSITTAENCILGPGFFDITTLTQGDVSFNHGAVTDVGGGVWHFSNTTNIVVTP